MLNYEDARALIFQNVKPLEKCNRPLTESQGLALSEDILAPHGLPSFDNSGVDGYAVEAEDLAQASTVNPVTLENLGYIAAGDSENRKISSGQCMQIATGAPLPKGADSVVMKENIEVEGSKIRFIHSIQEKEHVEL
jgi:molybdopterin molybdotransferase